MVVDLFFYIERILFLNRNQIRFEKHIAHDTLFNYGALPMYKMYLKLPFENKNIYRFVYYGMQFIIKQILVFSLLVEISSLRLDSVESIIHDDAFEIQQLFDTVMSYRPAVSDEIFGLYYCPFIGRCCTAEEQIQALRILEHQAPLESESSTAFLDLKSTCEKFSTKSDENCSLPFFSVDLKKYEQDAEKFEDYVKVLMSIQHDNPFSKVFDNCARISNINILCSLSNDLFNCVHSTLIDIHKKDGLEVYETLVRTAKKNGHDLIVELSSKFPKI